MVVLPLLPPSSLLTLLCGSLRQSWETDQESTQWAGLPCGHPAYPLYLTRPETLQLQQLISLPPSLLLSRVVPGPRKPFSILFFSNFITFLTFSHQKPWWMFWARSIRCTKPLRPSSYINDRHKPIRSSEGGVLLEEQWSRPRPGSECWTRMFFSARGHCSVYTYHVHWFRD